MKHINISCEEIQRIQIEFITRDNDTNKHISFPLDINKDMTYLETILKDNQSYIGILMNASYYKENTYVEGSLGLWEFAPLKYYYVGESQGDFYSFCGQKYCKLPYIEVVKDEQELREKLANVILSAKEAEDISTLASLYGASIPQKSKLAQK